MHRLAVFVDGCFWHGDPLHATAPKTNAAFWRKKIAANRTRDRLVTRTLRALGWRVLRIWEHELIRKTNPAASPGPTGRSHDLAPQSFSFS
jgi:DNA mismatch endonuclease, patch repair protein